MTRSERSEYRKFREALLEGSDPDKPMDTPMKRATAAAVHLRTQAEIEQGNLTRLDALEEKAERDAQHARDAVTAQQEAVELAVKQADWAAEVVKDLDAEDPGQPGEHVQVQAEPAEGRG